MIFCMTLSDTFKFLPLDVEGTRLWLLKQTSRKLKWLFKESLPRFPSYSPVPTVSLHSAEDSLLFHKLLPVFNHSLTITGAFKVFPSSVLPPPQIFHPLLSPAPLQADDTLPLTATKCPLAVAVNDFYEHIIYHLVKTLAWFQLLIPELTVSLSLTGFSLAGGNLNFALRPSKGNWNESPQWPGWTFLVLCCGPWPRSSNVFLICHRSDNDQILITHPWLLFFTVVVLQKNYG